MKSIKNTLKGLLAALLLFGCSEDFLDVQSEDQIAEDNFWQSREDAQLALNGVYSSLQSAQLYGGVLNGWAGIFTHEGLTDNMFNRWKWEGVGLFVEGNADPTVGFVGNFWTQSYAGIFRANSVIEQLGTLPEGQLEEEERADFEAQALFVRALHYFNLALTFEDVPLILKTQSVEEAFVPKNEQAQILDQVVADLTAAAEALPADRDAAEFGYATKGAAYGLLARVYLFRGQFAEAAAAAQEVISIGYSLHPDYAALFTPEEETSDEIVFSIRFFRSEVGNNAETFSATYNPVPKVDHQPMPNLLHDYYGLDGLPTDFEEITAENRPQIDPRLTATFWLEGDMFLIDPEQTFNGNTNTGYGLRKYLRRGTAEDGTGPGGGGSQDYYLIRYADVLLMRAEALIETGDVGQEVYDLIDQVRERSSMPKVADVEGTGLSQSELREIVRHERRVELAFEGLRFYDLKRWGEIEEGYDRMLFDIANRGVTQYSPLYQGERSEIFPIPQSEIDANPELEQHPAW